MKKPIKLGGVSIRTPTGKVRTFSRDGAQREANRLAIRHNEQPCRGVVKDTGSHFEIHLIVSSSQGTLNGTQNKA